MGCWAHVSHCYEVSAMSGSGVDVEPVIRSEPSPRQRWPVPTRTSLVVSACLLGLGLAGCWVWLGCGARHGTRLKGCRGRPAGGGRGGGGV